MTLAAYNGHEALTFTDYTDLATGQTLHAEPREEPYDVAPASGRAVPEVPEPWFTVIQDGAPGLSSEEAGEPAHDEDPETDTSQQS